MPNQRYGGKECYVWWKKIVPRSCRIPSVWVQELIKAKKTVPLEAVFRDSSFDHRGGWSI